MKNNTTNTSNVRKDIIEIVSRITRIDQSGITDEVLIREELGIDSLMAIEIVANIEKYYNVTIDESFLNNVETVGEFVALVESIISQV